jgi:sarcosine oxidase, subunit delta
MLLIPCPYCEEQRPEVEFTYGGQAHIARPLNPSDLSDAQWEEYIYIRANPKGKHAERWRHTHGCCRFFNTVRDTVRDHFLCTYKAGEACPIVLEGDAA